MAMMEEADVRLVPDLGLVRDEFRSIAEAAGEVGGGLTPEMFNWRPAPDRWSVGQCLDHLNVTGFLPVPRLDAAIAEAKRRGRLSGGPFRYGWLDRWFVRSVGPSAPRKVRTMRVYAPASEVDPNVVLPRFLDLQNEMIRCVEAANGVDLAAVKVASPAASMLRLSLGTWFAATAAHERRHLAQARHVRESIPARH
jgi:hypothetical protein